jgi:hypothetical protein
MVYIYYGSDMFACHNIFSRPDNIFYIFLLYVILIYNILLLLFINIQYEYIIIKKKTKSDEYLIMDIIALCENVLSIKYSIVV